MKPFSFGTPVLSREIPWLIKAIREIEMQSQQDIGNIADEYTITNFTPTRTLNAATATVSDIANVLATFIDDIKRRGSARID